MKTRITGIITFVGGLMVVVWSSFVIFDHKYIYNINAVFTLLIILSICAMLYVYWTKFGALDQKMDRIQRQNKLIQSQIDFEKIRKDIEQKKLKKKSDEDWFKHHSEQGASGYPLGCCHNPILISIKSSLFIPSGLLIILSHNSKWETYYTPQGTQ